LQPLNGLCCMKIERVARGWRSELPAKTSIQIA
jgi:hypothetical protein